MRCGMLNISDYAAIFDRFCIIEEASGRVKPPNALCYTDYTGP
jgi:hypothetical protein